MILSESLEVFPRVVSEEQGSLTSVEESVQDAHLRSFEEGYSAGWEDSLKSRQLACDRIAEQVSSAMESFTIERNEFSNKFAPKIAQEIVNLLLKIMSKYADELLVRQLEDYFRTELEGANKYCYQVAVSSDQHKFVSQQVANAGWEDVLVLPDDALGVGQAKISVDSRSGVILDAKNIIRKIENFVEERTQI